MDEKDRALYDEKIRGLDQRIIWLEKHEETCKQDIFPRLNSLEQWKASVTASAMRSAFVTGLLSMTGALIAVLLTHLLRFLH